MGEEALDDPPLGRYHEPLDVVAAIDDHRRQGKRGQAVLDVTAGVATIGPNSPVCAGVPTTKPRRVMRDR
ncbi:hypothetical protein ABT150_39290 [Streptomyces mirabilis]|uniref:hypothetical protein n=1 Tax=Streptomyces mirabilis TaxID=68239 RepID=UPI0033294EA0